MSFSPYSFSGWNLLHTHRTARTVSTSRGRTITGRNISRYVLTEEDGVKLSTGSIVRGNNRKKETRD